MHLSTEMLQQIEAWRAAGFTQREMALHLGCSPTTLWYALAGKKRCLPYRGKAVPVKNRRRCPKEVSCLRCGDSFITKRDMDAIPLHRLCESCRKYIAVIEAGALA
jgi:hypothetical protein